MSHTQMIDRFLKSQNIKKINLESLKKRRIVSKKINLNDTIDSTWLKGHPSLGKEDAVVWQYESVLEECRFREIYNIPVVLKKIPTIESVIMKGVQDYYK